MQKLTKNKSITLTKKWLIIANVTLIKNGGSITPYIIFIKTMLKHYLKYGKVNHKCINPISFFFKTRKMKNIHIL